VPKETNFFIKVCQKKDMSRKVQAPIHSATMTGDVIVGKRVHRTGFQHQKKDID
jgi:hypothetical protein